MEYCELPKNFCSHDRKLRAHSGEVWLIDQSLDVELIKLQKVIGHASITISLHNDQRSTHHFYISEIIYKFKGYWKIRNVSLEY